MDDLIRVAINNDIVKGLLIDCDKPVGAVQVPTSGHEVGEWENDNMRFGKHP